MDGLFNHPKYDLDTDVVAIVPPRANLIEAMHVEDVSSDKLILIVPDDVLGGLSDADFKEAALAISVKDVISQPRHRTSRNKSDRKRNRANRW